MPPEYPEITSETPLTDSYTASTHQKRPLAKQAMASPSDATWTVFSVIESCVLLFDAQENGSIAIEKK